MSLAVAPLPDACRSPDVDGRTPLHWAAYKGFAHSMRLLIVLDAQISTGDREGCTPLHWAAIRGNSEACTVLLQVCAAPLPVYDFRQGSMRWLSQSCVPAANADFSCLIGPGTV